MYKKVIWLVGDLHSDFTVAWQRFCKNLGSSSMGCKTLAIKHIFLTSYHSTISGITFGKWLISLPFPFVY